jgi:CRISPR-associated endoribonuclease Cas6
MPYQWRLLLQPSSATFQRQVTPAQLHGLTCALLEDAGADHHGQHKPFSVTPLLQAPEDAHLAELRLGWLDDEAVPPLEKLTGDRVRLGAQFFTVRNVQGGGIPYTALRAHPPARRATFEFRSATYFARRGRWLPLPDPVLVYAGLARRWDAFAPEPLDPDLVRDLLNTVALTAHDIRTAPVDLGPSIRIGFTGHAAFTLDQTATNTATRGLFAALTRYADVAGTGAQTTHGLGWTNTEPHTAKT